MLSSSRKRRGSQLAQSSAETSRSTATSWHRQESRCLGELHTDSCWTTNFAVDEEKGLVFGVEDLQAVKCNNCNSCKDLQLFLIAWDLCIEGLGSPWNVESFTNERLQLHYFHNQLKGSRIISDELLLFKRAKEPAEADFPFKSDEVKILKTLKWLRKALEDAINATNLVLDGYFLPVEETVNILLERLCDPTLPDIDGGRWQRACSVLNGIVDRYLAVECIFAGKKVDAVMREQIRINSGELDTLLKIVLAHARINQRTQMV